MRMRFRTLLYALARSRARDIPFPSSSSSYFFQLRKDISTLGINGIILLLLLALLVYDTRRRRRRRRFVDFTLFLRIRIRLVPGKILLFMPCKTLVFTVRTPSPMIVICKCN